MCLFLGFQSRCDVLGAEYISSSEEVAVDGVGAMCRQEFAERSILEFGVSDDAEWVMYLALLRLIVRASELPAALLCWGEGKWSRLTKGGVFTDLISKMCERSLQCSVT